MDDNITLGYIRVRSNRVSNHRGADIFYFYGNCENMVFQEWNDSWQIGGRKIEPPKTKQRLEELIKSIKQGVLDV